MVMPGPMSENYSGPPVVLYHGGCRDGSCAAWVAQRRYPAAELIPVNYGAPPPDIDGRDVFFVDFSYPRPVMKEFMIRNDRVVVLDHHATAEVALKGLVDELQDEYGPGVQMRDEVVFDMKRSGAGIAWDYFFPWRDAPDPCPDCGGKGHDYKKHPDSEWRSPRHHRSSCSWLRPWFVDYIEDRDLWAWQLPASREINAYLATLSYEPAAHTPLVDMVAFGEPLAHGRTCLRALESYVSAALADVRFVYLGEYLVPSVNVINHNISEVLDRLRDGHPEAPFVLGWWRRSDGLYQHSLRSRAPFDVSAVARQYGGGGHPLSAGFETPLPRWRDK